MHAVDTHQWQSLMGLLVLISQSNCLRKDLEVNSSLPVNERELPEFEIFYDGKVINITKRQKQCLLELAKGKTAKETGRKLFISPRTVEQHLDNLKTKFCCSNKRELLGKLLLADFKLFS